MGLKKSKTWWRNNWMVPYSPLDSATLSCSSEVTLTWPIQFRYLVQFPALPSVRPWPGVWPRPWSSSSPGMPTISWGTTWRAATSTTTSATSMSTTFFGVLSSWFRAFRRTIVSRIPFGFYFSHHFFQLVLPGQTGFLSPDFTINFGPLVCFIWKKINHYHDIL